VRIRQTGIEESDREE